ncbi:MAG TPA: CHAT domain-containing protein [Anaerolineales bacterium]|nr:CHAT domain-containing protein [Anaerolineales bacterium]
MNNLDLLLASLSEARVIASPQGRSPGDAPLGAFPAPVALGEVSLAELQPVGLDLFNAIVHDTGLRDLISANFTAAGVANADLRLRLQIDPPELRRLPWEALYREPTGFLSLREVSVARYIAVGAQTNRPAVTQLPLKILVASAEPSELPKLNFEAERKNLSEALADEIAKGWVQLEFVEHATWNSAREALEKFNPHVFHFSGHGHFKDEKASLAFEDDHGDTRAVPPDDVALLFARSPDLRLVVLNACETAIDSTTRPLTGIAPKILQRVGVPAVVAMQAPILDRAAIAFSRAFYNRLAEGKTVDEAMREGRLAIYSAVSNSAHFAVPVLFLSSDEGLLVAFPQQIKDRVTTQARKGFETVQLGPADDLTTQSLNRWQINLTLATALYKKLAAWKSLHDLLHDLNETMEFVAQEVIRLDKNAPDFSYLADQWASCQTYVRALIEFAKTGAVMIAGKLFVESGGNLSGDPWIVEVLIAARSLDAAINESNLKTVPGAARRLRQATQTHMNAADKQIQDLAVELSRLTDRWTDPKLLPTTPELTSAVSELMRLHSLLFIAVEKHECFQNLDNDFVRLRDEVRRGLDWDAINAAWDFCRSDVLDSRFIPFAKKIGDLTVTENGYGGAEWCVEVVQQADNLGQQIAAEEGAAVRTTVRSFGKAIRTHFFIADKELKELTATLDSLSDDLLQILHR